MQRFSVQACLSFVLKTIHTLFNLDQCPNITVVFLIIQVYMYLHSMHVQTCVHRYTFHINIMVESLVNKLVNLLCQVSSTKYLPVYLYII